GENEPRPPSPRGIPLGRAKEPARSSQADRPSMAVLPPGNELNECGAGGKGEKEPIGVQRSQALALVDENLSSKKRYDHGERQDVPTLQGESRVAHARRDKYHRNRQRGGSGQEQQEPLPAGSDEQRRDTERDCESAPERAGQRCQAPHRVDTHAEDSPHD